MTPDELEWALAGFQRRQAREYQRLAWMVSSLLGAWVKKAPTPAQLLGPQMTALLRTTSRTASTTEDDD